jgi:large subunit ribosomal protein L30
MAKKLKVTLVRSGINRPEPQKQTIRGLGLGKMGRSVVLTDNPSVRGMIRSVSHLVRVESAD